MLSCAGSGAGSSEAWSLSIPFARISDTADVTIALENQYQGTSSDKAFLTYLLCQPQHTYARPIGLLRMLFVFKDALDQAPYISIYTLCSLQEVLCIPFSVLLVLRGQVIRVCGVVIGAFQPFVNSNTMVVVIHLDLL